MIKKKGIYKRVLTLFQNTQKIEERERKKETRQKDIEISTALFPQGPILCLAMCRFVKLIWNFNELNWMIKRDTHKEKVTLCVD